MVIFVVLKWFSVMFAEPGLEPVTRPSRFEIVDTLGHLAAKRKLPARKYVIIQIPDSSLHYGLIDDHGELTDWIDSPIPNC